MTKRHWITATIGLALCLPASIGAAQWDASQAPPPDQAQAAPDQAQAAPPPTHQLKQEGIQKLFQWSLNIGVPVFLNVDLQRVRPGADLGWVGGLDIGYVVFGFGVGVMWTPIDLNGYMDDNGNTYMGGRSPLTRLYFFPEIRFQVPNDSIVLPYLTGAFDVNWWNFKETGLVCGFWFCSTSSIYRFTPGFTSKVGLAFELKRGVKLDVGMKWSMSGKGDFFAETRWWLTPYLGVLVRRQPG
jgi:hypothetical protein